MQKLPAVVSIVALVAAVAGVVLWLLSEDPRDNLALDADRPPEMAEAKRPEALDVEIAKGGVFAGKVVDMAGQPIKDAHVLLVAFNAGDDDLFSGKGRGDRPFDPGDPDSIPVVGGYEIGGREATTDEKGEFTVPASSKARVTHVLAFHREYFVNAVKVPAPMDGIVVPLNKAGRFKGRIVDDESGRPVSNCRVDLYLQHPAALAPEVGTGQEGSLVRGRHGVAVQRSELAMLGNFLAKELGERLWGIPFQNTEALRFPARSDGTFEIGPLGEGVQLEFVITHPDYAWYDFDTDGGKKRAQRTIVHPGETVEREFRMHRGKEISGRVVDPEGKPIEGVVLAFESITQYGGARHWWDAIGKKRYAKTDKQGRFQMGGLSIGKHNIRLTHDSFGEHWEHGVAAGTKDNVFTIKQTGRIVGTIEGLLERPLGGRVQVTLEPTGPNKTAQMRLAQERYVIDKQNKFSIEHVKEGPYEIWVAADTLCSMPQSIVVEAGTPVHVTFELGGGGEISADLIDETERAVDPAVAYLVRIDERGESTMGRYVARQGLVETDNLLPGRYRLRIEAPGYVPLVTDPFDVLEGRPTHVGVLRLTTWAYLRLQSVLTDRRQPPPTDTLTEYREGDGEWKPLRNLGGYDVPVQPGSITVRARTTDDGLHFEQSYDAVGGQVTTVSVVLR